MDRDSEFKTSMAESESFHGFIAYYTVNRLRFLESELERVRVGL